MTYTIEKDVPLPADVIHRSAKYPFRLLKPGHSFTVPAKLRKSIDACAYNYGKKLKAKFIVRKVDANTVRVWRAK